MSTPPLESTPFSLSPNFVGVVPEQGLLVGSQIDKLMRELDGSYGDRLSGPQDVQEASKVPGHYQIVATDAVGTLVGTANLSRLEHSFEKDGSVTETPTLWLGSFVVSHTARGQGVAQDIWNAMRQLGTELGVNRLQFMTEAQREAAVTFYKKMGAQTVDAAFLFDIATSTTGDMEELDGERPPVPSDSIYEIFMGRVALVLLGKDDTPLSQPHELDAVARRHNVSKVQVIIPTDANPAALEAAQALSPSEPSQELIMSYEWTKAA